MPDAPEFQVVGGDPHGRFRSLQSGSRPGDAAGAQNGSYRPGYLPPDVAGGEALDQYGQWQNDPNYGNVWVPNEPPGWAPYQDGPWVDENYYGWTWVGAEPWGWAPYHYGSWYMGPLGLGLVAGCVRSVRISGGRRWSASSDGAPELGIGVGFGFGFGNVGWVPLAPYEAFHPWYGAGAVAGRFGGSNVAAVNAFRNARVATRSAA